MQNKIKNIINKNLHAYIRHLDKCYCLSKVSPVLFRHIKEFILRDGKRVRPTLLVAGYLGFSKKPARNLYKTALSIELLHDFMLVHDDIIDKSDTRRGKPSMHKMFNSYLTKFKKIKFNGQDLAIVAGDVMYAMAIDTFLSIDEKMERKEKALKKFIQAAVYTGMGEFIELMGDLRTLEKFEKEDIYKVYDHKTAHYTFASPLSTGAILAGANDKEVKNLYSFGMNVGRAFQIKDDLIGMFADEKKIGKSTLTDLQEAKKTLLIWHAYTHGNKKEKSLIRGVFAKDKVTKADLYNIRKIVKDTGAERFAHAEISRYIKKAQVALSKSALRSNFKIFLRKYSQKLMG